MKQLLKPIFKLTIVFCLYLISAEKIYSQNNPLSLSFVNCQNQLSEIQNDTCLNIEFELPENFTDTSSLTFELLNNNNVSIFSHNVVFINDPNKNGAKISRSYNGQPFGIESGKIKFNIPWSIFKQAQASKIKVLTNLNGQSIVTLTKEIL